MDQLLKNKIISEKRKGTALKRKSQVCKTFKFKVDKSSLSKSQKETLKMFFVEAKRVYNYILGSEKDPFSLSYKDLKKIIYLDKDKNPIEYNIQYLGSSVIDEIVTMIEESIKGLSASKKNGNKIGGLRFKSECNSIRLRQYGITHSIRGNRIKIQGIKRPIRVNGIKQLEKYDNIDLTIANLLYDGYDYFVSLTCFIDKEEKQDNDTIIGIDLGCSSTITTSEGEKISVSFEESERLKGLQARLAKQTKGSNRRYKTLLKIRKEYNRTNNKKNDISNKIVHRLTQYGSVIIQDDQINEWHENKYLSKTVQHSILGRIKMKLKNKDNVYVLNRWFPTTKHCFDCGTDIDIDLSNRTFKCPVCGSISDRDIHAAKNMIEFYKRAQSAGTVDLKPGKPISYDQYQRLVEREARLPLAAG